METDNKSGGTTDATAAASNGGGGRLLVEESYCGIKSDRLRFQIDLKHGETTIVSWTKLLKDSGIPVDQSSPHSPEPPKRLHQEDESRSECSKIVLKKEKEEQNYRSPATKKQRNATSEVLEGINVVKGAKNSKIGHARVKSTIDQNFDNKTPTFLSSSVSIESRSSCGMTSDRAAIFAKSQSINLIRHVSEENSVNNGKMELPDLNVPYTLQAASTSPTQIKKESGGTVNGSMLDNTILEMETMAAQSRQLHGDVQDADHLASSRSRLPQELKQKLEIVARLAHSSQGRISDEVIMRLVSILGHWLKPRTLKRCLRDMIPPNLSAWGGDTVRFNQIKKEVVEMIKLRYPSMETKDGSSNEIIELHGSHKANYWMDEEMEDKICDYYDIYVQGVDEIKSSEIRKFYIQLAALWPKGTMDNHGIRSGICRAKERRRKPLQEKGQEKGKQKKPSTAEIDEDLHEEANVIADSKKKPLNDISAPVITFTDTVVPKTPELDQNVRAPAKRFSPPSASSCQDLRKRGKFDIISKTA